MENGKPDPEIYLLVSRNLGVPLAECLVIEDSAAGVKAALAAGMKCIVVTTEFTRESVHQSGLLEERWVVDDPANLMNVAKLAIGMS
jgi:beta-phosphoglucomutase-like phosphatase (HAD superfamily)